MDPRQYIRLRVGEIQAGDVVSFLDPETGSHRTRYVTEVGIPGRYPGPGYILVSPVVVLISEHFDIIGEPIVVPIQNIRVAGRLRSSYLRGIENRAVTMEGLRRQGCAYA